MGHLIYSPLDKCQKRHYTKDGSFAALFCCLEHFYQLEVGFACGNPEGPAACEASTSRPCRGVLCRARNRILMIPWVPPNSVHSVTLRFCHFLVLVTLFCRSRSLREALRRRRGPCARASPSRAGTRFPLTNARASPSQAGTRFSLTGMRFSLTRVRALLPHERERASPSRTCTRARTSGNARGAALRTLQTNGPRAGPGGTPVSGSRKEGRAELWR